MSILVREVELNRDYGHLEYWWKSQAWSPVPRMFLPYGLMAVVDDGPACAGFLYFDVSTPIGWLEWIVANPAIRHEVRTEALDVLIESLCAKAKARGVTAIFSSVKHPMLGARLKRHKFIETDKNVSHMMRVV